MGCLTSGERKTKHKKQMRLILLGIAGSGKTTFCKQMQIIHKGGFDSEQIETYKRILFLNIFTGMKLLVELAMEDITEDNRKKARFILSLEENDIEWNDELVDKLNTLWKDPAVHSVWLNRKESLLVPLDYLMDKFNNYLSSDYVLTHDDILRARQRSTGENVSSFEDDSNVWNLVDLGGQMSERAKWEAAFASHVHAIIFFLGIDEFDTINPETKTSTQFPTKLQLALSVLADLLDGPIVAEHKPSRIVFLNKSDLFKEKIADQKRFLDFKKYCNYESNDNSFEACSQFLENQIQESFVSDSLPTHTHVVCALDTETMKKVTSDIKMTIVTSSLQDMGIL